MFADQRVNRDTPCRRADDKEWKTIDDYLPTLKYGTQLPAATPQQISMPTPIPALAAQRVAVVDLDIPFGSVLRITFKWMAAAFVVWCCFLPVIITLWLIVMALFASLISGAMHHP